MAQASACARKDQPVILQRIIGKTQLLMNDKNGPAYVIQSNNSLSTEFIKNSRLPPAIKLLTYSL